MKMFRLAITLLGFSKETLFINLHVQKKNQNKINTMFATPSVELQKRLIFDTEIVFDRRL